MKHHQYITISICYLFFSCFGSKDVVATIQGENIYLSEIYQSIDETAFNALTPAKKRAFVRKYTVHKILTTKPKIELEEISLFIENEENRLKRGLIVQKVEKYIFDQLVVSDSLLELIDNSINIDIYVKAITVSHVFSFGKTNKRTKEEAYKRAKIIYDRIFSGELSFEEALSIYSESPVSKIKGNEMGQLYYGLMPKNFNDVVWSSPDGKLHEPLETSIGFHIVIVDHKIPKLRKNKREFERDKLYKEIIKGKYGFQEENFLKFIDTLYEKYDVSLNQVELYNVWDSVKIIEGVNSMSGIPVSMLKEVDHNNVIGRIGKKEITLDWIVKKANSFSFYTNVSINNGFLFNKLIFDVIAKHLMVQWYNDNKILFPEFEKTLKQKSVNKIYSLFLNKKQKHNPELTKDIILNQFMFNEGVIINNKLFAENSQ